jgi:hypothetical protein
MCRLARPPCRSRPGFHPASGDFYLRAFDRLVARSAAGYHYRDDWAIFSAGSFPLERQLASLQPLIEPDWQISRIRLSEKTHAFAHGRFAVRCGNWTKPYTEFRDASGKRL